MQIIHSKKRLVLMVCSLVSILLVICYVEKDLFINNDGDSIKKENMVEMISGQEFQIDKSLENMVWKSEDESIATVTSDGVIKARNKGKVIITAQTDGESYEYVIEVKEDESEHTKTNQDDEVASDESFVDMPDDDLEPVINDSLPILKVDNIKAKAGEKNVELAVSVGNNPGILGMSFNVNYDENAVKLVKVKSGTAVENVLTFTPSNELSTGCKFIWDGTELRADQIRDGDVLVLSFDILADAEDGEYSIDISYGDGDIVDYKLIPIDMNIQKGKIYIKK